MTAYSDTAPLLVHTAKHGITVCNNFLFDQQRDLSPPDLGHRYQARYKWFWSLKTSSSTLAITLPRILATVAQFWQMLHLNMSDATGSADASLAALVTPTASVAGTSDSDAQTPVTFTTQMQKELTDKFLSVEEDRKILTLTVSSLSFTLV